MAFNSVSRFPNALENCEKKICLHDLFCLIRCPALGVFFLLLDSLSTLKTLK